MKLVALLFILLSFPAESQDARISLPIDHSGNVSHFSFNNDSSFYATSDGASIKVWHNATHALINTIPLSPIRLTFTEQLHELFIMSKEELTYINVFSLEKHTYPIRSLEATYLIQNEKFAVWHDLTTINVWDITRKQPISEFENPYSEIDALFVSTDGNLVIATNGRSILTHKGGLTKEFELPEKDRFDWKQRIEKFDVSPDQNALVVPLKGEILLYNFETNDTTLININKRESSFSEIYRAIYLNNDLILAEGIEKKHIVNLKHKTIEKSFNLTINDSFTKVPELLTLIKKNNTDLKDFLALDDFLSTKNSITTDVKASFLSKNNQWLATIVHQNLRVRNFINGNLLLDATIRSEFNRITFNQESNKLDFFLADILVASYNFNSFNIREFGLDKRAIANIDSLSYISIDNYSYFVHQLENDSLIRSKKIYFNKEGKREFSLDHIKCGAYQPATNQLTLLSGEGKLGVWNMLENEWYSLIKTKDLELDFVLPYAGSDLIVGVEINWDNYPDRLYVLHFIQSAKGKVVFSMKSKSYPKNITIKNGQVWIHGNENSLQLFELSKKETALLFETNSIAFTRDSSIGYYAENEKIKIIDLSSQSTTTLNLSIENTISHLNLSMDEKLLFITSIDGGITILDIAKEEKVFIYYELQSAYDKLIVEPQGGYDATGAIADRILWISGETVLHLDELEQILWKPNLWSSIMNNEMDEGRIDVNNIKLHPKVELTADKDILTINLTKRDGGYGKVAIFINGKEVINDARGNNLDTNEIQQSINYSLKDHPYLMNGENEIVVKASSADGLLEGRGELFKIHVQKEEADKPSLFGVFVGISSFANESINLNYSAKDAEDFAHAVQLGAEKQFKPEKTHIYSLTTSGDIQPNKTNIRNVFSEIASKAKSQDIVLVYLSGHGVTWGVDQKDFYYLTADATSSRKEGFNDRTVREFSTISTAEFVDWFKEIAALKQVMVIDACGSGKAVENLITSRDIEASQIKAIDRMKDRTGMFVISGSTADAASYEASVYGQGLLTYSLLQGMKGGALKEGKYVDVSAIMNHARETVPVLAKGLGGIQEPQFLVPKGGSFDIGILEKEDQDEIRLAEPKRIFIRSILVDKKKYSDVLNLGRLLNDELGTIVSKGNASDIVFIDTDYYAGGCQITGGYTQADKNIVGTITIACKGVETIHEIKGNNSNDFIQKIIGLIKNYH